MQALKEDGDPASTCRVLVTAIPHVGEAKSA